MNNPSNNPFLIAMLEFISGSNLDFQYRNNKKLKGKALLSNSRREGDNVETSSIKIGNFVVEIWVNLPRVVCTGILCT